MADKYIYNNAGTLTEREATVVSAGAGNAGDIVALDGSGKLDTSVMPTGIGADTASVVSSENLAAGDLVNIWNDAGTVKVRKADATTAGKEAHGFVLAAVTSPANATVYFEGSNTQATGSLTGGVVYLTTTAGTVSNTAPSGSGNVVQRVGFVTASGSPNTVNFQSGVPIVLA
jgi:hypothetical protein